MFLLEAQIMAEFDHENGTRLQYGCLDACAVLKLLGVSTSEEPWCMVTELCELGDLRRLLKKCKEQSFELSCEEQLRMVGHIASGMNYLSSLQFIHRVT